MEKLFYEMFENGFFSDIFFVDENPAKIEIEKIYKENGEIIKETINHEFVLSRYETDEKDIKSHLLHSFFKNLYFSDRKDIKYFNRGFLKNIFTKPNPKSIFDEITKWDWVITTPKVISELNKLNNFTPLNGSKDIKSIGVFMDQYYNTSVYQKPYDKYDEDIIFLGNYDSITPVINKNIIKEDNKIYIEYQFNMTGKTKKIILS